MHEIAMPSSWKENRQPLISIHAVAPAWKICSSRQRSFENKTGKAKLLDMDFRCRFHVAVRGMGYYPCRLVYHADPASLGAPAPWKFQSKACR